MADFVLTDAVLRGADGVEHGLTAPDSQPTRSTVDNGIRDGRIDRIVPNGKGNPDAFDLDQRFDADGRLATPTFAEPHTHLATANTFAALLRDGYEMPRPEAFGVGWQMYDDLKEGGMLEPDSIVDRASTHLD